MSTTDTQAEGRLLPQDLEFYERELASFLPDRVFDAHTHLWRRQDTGWTCPAVPMTWGSRSTGS